MTEGKRCSYRNPLDEAEQTSLEAEAMELFRSISAETDLSGWQHSEVESLYAPLIQTLMRMPTFLRRFRRTFIAGGRLNFPDVPRPKANYLQFDSLPAGQAWSGQWKLLGMLIKLYRYQRFNLADAGDKGVGRPLCIHVPESAGGLLSTIARRYLKMKNIKRPSYYCLTEAQTRFLYYRLQIASVFGTSFDTVLEIGGGFGGLCGEVMGHCSVQRYYVVELPESVPLCYFYLKALLDVPVQVVYRATDHISPEARVVIMPPWRLPTLEETIGIAINTMSFQHMNLTNLHYYFQEIGRLQTAKMYLVNRNKARDPEDVIMDHYPIPEGIKVVRQLPHLFGTGAHIERFYSRVTV